MADSPAHRAPPRRLLSGISIAYKLPLFVSVLLLTVIVLSSWAGYRGVRDAAFTAARVRLNGVADQFAAQLQSQAVQVAAAVARAAANDTLRRFLEAPTAKTRLDALSVMRHVGPAVEQVISVELWSTQHERLLVTGTQAASIASGRQTEGIQWAPQIDTGRAGRLQLGGDSVLYPVSALVPGPRGPLGYVVQWRRATSSPQSRDSTVQQIGSGAALYVGNDRGDFWTDLLVQAPAPPVDVRNAKGFLTYERPQTGRVMAVARSLSPLPWVVLVELRERDVGAAATAVTWRLAFVELALVALGLFAASAMGRRISAPLRDLTAASAAIAAGDYSRDVAVRRDGEIGKLAATFTAMAHRVREAQNRLEDQVRERTAELEERNDELEAFGYSISHDLRAPLRAMQGFSQALLDDCGDRLDAMGREYAERIVAGARRMDELIRDLLAYSRVSRAELQLMRVPLSPVAHSALAELSGPLRARNANVQVDEPLLAVMGHPATLSQVLTYLIGNGLKFVPPERTPELRIRTERHNGLVRVWVEDNGIGIAPEHQARIFRVFERLHSADDDPGTGIGLAIVRKAVQRMGGQVGVESMPGHGSRFWVELQAAVGEGV
ncbi:MAG TPA: ATP-binding protein [Gemmatimonadales bacterium]|nr:ATP-binding protein [Gemmatimonadales bacterium]